MTEAEALTLLKESLEQQHAGDLILTIRQVAEARDWEFVRNWLATVKATPMFPEVTVAKLDVEIKALRVGGEKLTFSMFNQLPVTDLETFFNIHLPPNRNDLEKLLPDWWEQVFDQANNSVVGYMRHSKELILIGSIKKELYCIPFKCNCYDTELEREIRVMPGGLYPAVRLRFSQVFIDT